MRLNLARLSVQAMREICQQICLACNKHYRAPRRIYWPFPCGHGFCKKCLDDEASKLREHMSAQLGFEPLLDDLRTLRVGSEASSDPESAAGKMACPVCHATATLQKVGL